MSARGSKQAGLSNGLVFKPDVGMLVQIVHELLRHLRPHDFGDLLHGGLAHVAHGAEAPDEVALALIPDPLNVLEHGIDDAPLAKLLMIGIGEPMGFVAHRSEEHTSELQSRSDLVCRLLLEKKKKKIRKLTKIKKKKKKNKNKQ